MTEQKFPSFFATWGFRPVAGKDYPLDEPMCQDDAEYFSGTGRYTDFPETDDEGAILDVVCDETGEPV